MSADSVRTSIDLPRELHRQLHEAAARKGVSARKLILAGIERALADGTEHRPQKRLDPDSSPIIPAGRHIVLPSPTLPAVCDEPSFAESDSATARPRRRLRLDPPLITPDGRHIRMADEEIYELIEFP